MKALTLHRPWDQLILHGIKPVENRPWTTKYRGDLLIHAGNKYADEAFGLAAQLGIVIPIDGDGPNLSSESPKGIGGVVELIDVCGDAIDGGPCDCGPWAFPHQYHWKLTNPRRFPKYVPAKGALSLWTPEPEVLDATDLPHLVQP